MVCVPCVFIPILLLLWRFLIQPLVIKLWQLRMKRKDAVEEGPPQLVKKCENGVCSMAWERSPKTSKVE